MMFPLLQFRIQANMKQHAICMTILVGLLERTPVSPPQPRRSTHRR